MPKIQVKIRDAVHSAIAAAVFADFADASVPAVVKSYLFDRKAEDFQPEQAKPIISVWISGIESGGASARSVVQRDYGIPVRVEKLLDMDNLETDVDNLTGLVEEIQALFEPNDEEDPPKDGVLEIAGEDSADWQNTTTTPISDQMLASNIFQQDILFTYRY